jgi:hypothetical protein
MEHKLTLQNKTLPENITVPQQLKNPLNITEFEDSLI